MPSVIVVGAGPAGLASSYTLTRARIDHLVLEAGDIGETWTSLYDSLVLHTGKHMSALPGSPFPRSTPLFPSRAAFVDYLRDYATMHALPISTRTRVNAVRRDEDGWSVDVHREPAHLTIARTRAKSSHAAAPRAADDVVAAGEVSGGSDGHDVARFQARALVWATGVVANPYLPDFPGREAFRGEVLHSVDYRRPGPFLGRRVLVVGTGNSGGEIAAELAQAGASVAIAARSGAYVVPRTIAGIPIQYVARHTMSHLPRPMQAMMQRAMSRVSARLRGSSGLPMPHQTPGVTSGDAARPAECRNVPLIGFHLTDAIRARLIDVRPALSAFVPDGVRFADGREEAFDVVLLATGFRPALGLLDGLVRRDACGFARRDGVVSLDQPDLYFVGQTYDVRGALLNIGHDAQRVARLIARCPASGHRS